MKDDHLLRTIVAAQEFLDHWLEFGKQLRSADREFTPGKAEEEQFTALKLTLTEKYEVMLRLLEEEPAEDDRTLAVVAEAGTFESLKEMSGSARKMLYKEWHHALIYWQSVLGKLKAREMEVAAVGLVGFAFRQALQNPLVVLVVLGMMIYAIFMVLDSLQLLPRR